ncbi:MAG: HAMP domain-containing histidine kinase [Firmicutes bacterium]|nr:HAMP domain-containing histidine kinase [Bacillota bacterium]
MKKIPVGYYIAAAPLVIWAIVDLYHYAVIGSNLLEYYNGVSNIQKLVENSLVQAIVKMFLAVLIVVTGWWKAKGKKPVRSSAAVSLLLIVSIMGTWLVSMFTLTLVTAQEIYDGLYDKSQEYAEAVSRFGTLNMFYDADYSRYGYQYERPDVLENRMLHAIGYNTSASFYSGGNYDSYNHSTGEERHKLIRDVHYPMETAVLFYDADGNLLHSSEDDIMYFNYYTQEEWDAGMDSAAGKHCGWIDISEGKDDDWQDDPYRRFRVAYAGTHSLEMSFPIIRVKGYFEGNELKPVIMHYVSDAQIWEVVENNDQFSTGPDSYSYIFSDVDKTGDLEWQLQFDRSAEYEGKDLVTVYLDHPEMWDYQGNPFVYDRHEYESLADLTEAMDLPLKDSREYQDSSIFRLDELLVFGRWTGADYGKEYVETGELKTDFYLVTAIRSNPLACAISALRNIYIVTGLLALTLLLVVYSNIRKRLISPVADVAAAMEDGWRNIYRPEDAPAVWYEAEKLRAGFIAEQGQRRMKDNEITRLNTALEYAKTAEQNRRQMTSNIAHELKTPLAVIHSYAEGLKEHIAEDKRDKYIDIILSEVERTDRMVLEMLDLSRLEAGKVKLSRDDFSIISLTQVIFEKLEMAAQAKALQIEFAFPEDFTVTADEGRIAQVIENFATNAVKYTPAHGHITVKIQKVRSDVIFSIENESKPLSAEELRKVWDTFYRTDEARSGGGTGLGLAIAKNIIELHGGKCSVRNTKTGVEFSFVLKQ